MQLLQFFHFKNKYLFVKFFVFNLHNKIKLLPNDKIYFKSMLLYSEVICLIVQKTKKYYEKCPK